MYSNHTITPETETTCHYFWHHARNFNRSDASVTEFLRKAAGGAFFEVRDGRIQRVSNYYNLEDWLAQVR